MTDFKFTGPKYVAPQISSPSAVVGEGSSKDVSIVLPILAIIGCVSIAVWINNHFAEKRNHYYD